MSRSVAARPDAESIAPGSIEILRPDDWHLHLRDGEMLARVLPFTARCFGRAIVMPNLDPPVETTAAAHAYAERIRASLPEGAAFEPLMTLYLSERTTPDEVARAVDSPEVHGIKLYPRGATTNSERGVEDLDAFGPVFEAMAAGGLPLLVHGEVTDPEIDVFDREVRFLERTLIPLVDRHPGLRVVFEHITTRVAAEWVRAAPPRVGATITPQHLLLNRNALFEGGLRPHHYCLPVLKRERDREALVAAATSGDPRFFLGTDSAPHARAAKEAACGCAGVFSAPVAIEAYAEAFAEAGALDRLENFASRFGAEFYGLPLHRDRIRLERVDAPGPDRVGEGDDALTVFGAGRPFRYRLAS